MSEFCGCISVDCEECLEYSVAYCPPDFIDIPSTNLINHTQYYLWIRDKLGNIFVADFNIAPFGGHLQINTLDFPAGIFTPSFGAIDLFVSTDSQGQNVQPLIIDGETYNCIILKVEEPVYLTDDSGCFLLTDDEGNYLLAQ